MFKVESSKPLAKTQAAALEIIKTAGTIDRLAFIAQGGRLNALDRLIRKGLVIFAGYTTIPLAGGETQVSTYRVA